MDWFVMTGDDEQCHPPGEIVLTRMGYKCIEDLDPQIDRLASYDRDDASVYTGRCNGGYRFKKASRWYVGNIFKILCDQKTAKATDNHKWLVKWTDKAKEPDITVVYLMKKGPWFRIGWCQLMRADGCFHLAVRTRLERADSTWILKAVSSKAEASKWESYYSAQYGISTVNFEQRPNSGGHYTKELLNNLFGMFDDTEQFFRACKLLSDLNLSIKYPFWSKKKARTRRGGKSIHTVESCNLLPELMALPSHLKGKAVRWVPISGISVGQYDGIVYSLDVEKYHTYITNGLVTTTVSIRLPAPPPKDFSIPRLMTSSKQSYHSLTECQKGSTHKPWI